MKIRIQGGIELAVLRVLNGSELHGYMIVKRLNAIGASLFQTGEGTVYPLLLKLEQEGLVVSRWLERKKVYTLSKKGERSLAGQTKEWAELAQKFSAFLGAEP